MNLLPADMAGGAVQNRDGTYTVTDSSGQRFQMTEESFEEFIGGMGVTLDDLNIYRSMVTGGQVTRPREGAYPGVFNPGMFEQVDTTTLKFGGFDDALELQQVYKETFYPSRAEQLDRIYHGLDTGRVISEEIKEGYLNADGNVSADVENVSNEFDTSGGGLTENDVTEVQQQNEEDGLNEPADQDPGATS
ncbi:hypothetical protein L0U85_17290 [Glycomyces sp. L485]|uniref:hypothetical protein n=1 Tax=Glycomyces sp. L485 TaxID=2909235 RepID=UPI001F4B7223|nr:hypothetical protein [Glycomyces sp. L485]MCH7232594.1 hypothetical protein [Glycomyces sp. L485]